jgi:hypothetical protein
MADTFIEQLDALNFAADDLLLETRDADGVVLALSDFELLGAMAGFGVQGGVV